MLITLLIVVYIIIAAVTQRGVIAYFKALNDKRYNGNCPGIWDWHAKTGIDYDCGPEGKSVLFIGPFWLAVLLYWAILKYPIRFVKFVFGRVVYGIDYIGRELANPKENVKEL